MSGYESHHELDEPFVDGEELPDLGGTFEERLARGAAQARERAVLAFQDRRDGPVAASRHDWRGDAAENATWD